MAKNSSINLDITNNADGFDMKGGTVARKASFTGGDVTFTGSGSFIYTFPGATTTLVGTDIAQALSQKSFAANTTSLPSVTFGASAGIDVSSPTNGMVWWNGTQLYFMDGSQNRDLLRPRSREVIVFRSAFTPGGTGADAVVYSVPFSSVDGTTSITYNVKRLQIRVESASINTTSIQVEKSTIAGTFTPSSLLASPLSVSGFSTYEANTQTFSISQVSSGDKLRLNFTAVGGGHAGFSISLLLDEA